MQLWTVSAFYFRLAQKGHRHKCMLARNLNMFSVYMHVSKFYTFKHSCRFGCTHRGTNLVSVSRCLSRGNHSKKCLWGKSTIKGLPHPSGGKVPSFEEKIWLHMNFKLNCLCILDSFIGNVLIYELKNKANLNDEKTSGRVLLQSLYLKYDFFMGKVEVGILATQP